MIGLGRMKQILRIWTWISNIIIWPHQNKAQKSVTLPGHSPSAWGRGPVSNLGLCAVAFRVCAVSLLANNFNSHKKASHLSNMVTCILCMQRIWWPVASTATIVWLYMNFIGTRSSDYNWRNMMRDHPCSGLKEYRAALLPHSRNASQSWPGGNEPASRVWHMAPKRLAFCCSKGALGLLQSQWTMIPLDCWEFPPVFLGPLTIILLSPSGRQYISVSETQALLAACRELALDYNTLPELLYVFGHKT